MTLSLRTLTLALFLALASQANAVGPEEKWHLLTVSESGEVSLISDIATATMCNKLIDELCLSDCDCQSVGRPPKEYEWEPHKWFPAESYGDHDPYSIELTPGSICLVSPSTLKTVRCFQ